MKLILFLILLIGAIGYIAGKTTLTQKKCYDTTFAATEELSMMALSNGWGTQKVCQDRFALLSTLNACVTESTGSGKLAPIRTTLTNILLQFIRPVTIPVLQQETNHDTSCADYRTWQFHEIY
jgi:hypothetical protein